MMSESFLDNGLFQMENFEDKIIRSDNFQEISNRIVNHIVLKKKYCASIITGITTAYEIGDNQLREFVFANKIHQTLKDMGVGSELILINDTYDALSDRHVKILNTNGVSS